MFYQVLLFPAALFQNGVPCMESLWNPDSSWPGQQVPYPHLAWIEPVGLHF